MPDNIPNDDENNNAELAINITKTRLCVFFFLMFFIATINILLILPPHFS